MTSDLLPASTPVWPVNTDYSTHEQVTSHRHICPDCRRVHECPNTWMGEPCQAVEWFEHSDLCATEPLATADDIESLREHLNLIAPGYRMDAREAVTVPPC